MNRSEKFFKDLKELCEKYQDDIKDLDGSLEFTFDHNNEEFGTFYLYTASIQIIEGKNI